MTWIGYLALVWVIFEGIFLESRAGEPEDWAGAGKGDFNFPPVN